MIHDIFLLRSTPQTRETLWLIIYVRVIKIQHGKIYLASYCRQVDAAKYKNLFHGLRVTVAEEGVKGLAKGWAPTLIGYSMQGLCKFGFYEVFKNVYGDMMGEVCIVKIH